MAARCLEHILRTRRRLSCVSAILSSSIIPLRVVAAEEAPAPGSLLSAVGSCKTKDPGPQLTYAVVTVTPRAPSELAIAFELQTTLERTGLSGLCNWVAHLQSTQRDWAPPFRARERYVPDMGGVLVRQPKGHCTASAKLESHDVLSSSFYQCAGEEAWHSPVGSPSRFGPAYSASGRLVCNNTNNIVPSSPMAYNGINALIS